MIFNAISIKKIMNKTRIIEIQMLLVHAQFLAKSNISHVSPYMFQAKKKKWIIRLLSKANISNELNSFLVYNETSHPSDDGKAIIYPQKKIFFFVITRCLHTQ